MALSMMDAFRLCLLLLIQTTPCRGQSFNQPNLCPSATWNPSAVTFADNSTMGTHLSSIFVSTNDTVYAMSQSLRQLQIWLPGNLNVARGILLNTNISRGMFVSTEGDIYVDNGFEHNRVEKWRGNGSYAGSEFSVSGSCYGLFIDQENALYCSLGESHQVVKPILIVGSIILVFVAGNGNAGFTPYTLNTPHGLFVDGDLNLYVADYGNNRIQFFEPGQLNGVTIAGSGAPGSIDLVHPTTVMIDKKGYLYIVDSDNHRIVRSALTGFQCVVGCSGTRGSAAHQLVNPWTFSFDRFGNMFVNDFGNSRIQIFNLASNSCRKYQDVNDRSVERSSSIHRYSPQSTQLSSMCDMES